MRLGLIARRDNTGLGYQTRDYYTHLKPHKTMVIDLSGYNGNPQNLDWYPDCPVVTGFPNKLQLQAFLSDVDVVLTAETPYNYELYDLAKQMGVRVANVINWEFFDHYAKPELPKPDIIIMPSMWHYEEAEAYGLLHNIKVVYLHHPVDRTAIPYRRRTTGKLFHIAGKPAAHDRNGTADALQAFPDIRVTTQDESYARQLRRQYRQSDIRANIAYNELFTMGDILIFPRRYGGNCLPLNEALASGIPVIMPDIMPNSYLLPKEWVVPATIKDRFTPRTMVDIYQSDIYALRERAKWVQDNIAAESHKANILADFISWEVMLPKWQEVLA